MSDLSLRALARRVGVSQTAPYRHFADKDALIAVLKEEGMRKLGDGMRSLMATEKDPMIRLRKLAMVYVEFARDYPAHFKVMFEYELGDYNKYHDFLEISDKNFLYFRKTVNECLALPGAREIDPAVAQFSAWSMVHGLSVLLMNQSLIKYIKEDHFVHLGERDQIAEQVTEFFCNSLLKS
ncbi:MAG: TetR/AcrR family transcriptional regulator [Alphaproteobacteria bacterium]|nr:TetR/AcrR family transcriptional regulator [Alphaproteobacteria bacterium]